jgi:hypothetical protein
VGALDTYGTHTPVCARSVDERIAVGRLLQRPRSDTVGGLDRGRHQAGDEADLHRIADTGLPDSRWPIAVIAIGELNLKLRAQFKRNWPMRHTVPGLPLRCGYFALGGQCQAPCQFDRAHHRQRIALPSVLGPGGILLVVRCDCPMPLPARHALARRPGPMCAPQLTLPDRHQRPGYRLFSRWPTHRLTRLPTV